MRRRLFNEGSMKSGFVFLFERIPNISPNRDVVVHEMAMIGIGCAFPFEYS